MNMFDLKNKAPYIKKSSKGLSEELIRKISKDKQEPKWMLEKRLHAFHLFETMPLPTYGPSLKKVNFDELIYYASALSNDTPTTWDEVPKDIKNTFERLGIPQAERAMLAGVGAQYESTAVYHKLKEEWETQGVLFEDMDIALKKHESLVKEYFMSRCVSAGEHKFSALHGAIWSGGTFLYVPKNVHIDIPLQAYFRMNAKNMGQFEHTIIILDEGAEAHYIEGCSAPKYGTLQLHAGCVEIFVHKGARMRYTSVENWSKDTYNLNTKRAIISENGLIEWVGGNFGSGVTMLYPCSILSGPHARANHLGLAVAGEGQIQDTGAKVIHSAPYTSSNIVMKSISKQGGQSSYRGLVKVFPQAKHCTISVNCDALLLDNNSRSDTYPKMQIHNNQCHINHEATVGKISEDALFYLMSRGVKKEEATAMIVNGFIEPVTKSLPLEYAVEMNRLIEMDI